MELKVKDTKVDAAIVQGPMMKEWPTQGLKVLSKMCADAGLIVGWYGGAGVQVRGVLPLDAGGGVVMALDAQKRLHRISAKSVIKISPFHAMPMPFQGWYNAGLIPELSARKLLQGGSLSWQPVTVILGSGNRAMKLGCELLNLKVTQRVVCIESIYDEPQAWEVERRRFEIAGGKIIFGQLSKLTQKSPFLWELKVKDSQGMRIIDAGRVVSVGPFQDDLGFREYPAGSYLFEWENSQVENADDDVEQVLLDENRAVVLAAKIIKGIAEKFDKNRLDKGLWSAKQKLKELESTKMRRLSFQYDGKWLANESLNLLKDFAGTPKKLEKEKIKASIECIESIGCRACVKSCPANAIQIDRNATGIATSFLIEDACTGCGFCLQSCPSAVPIMIEGDASDSFTSLIFSDRSQSKLSPGEKIGLLNRKGEVLAHSKVINYFLEGEVPLVRVEVPSHLIWEARGITTLSKPAEVAHSNDLYHEKGERVDVMIQGDVRHVRDGQLISVALFEIGMSRPNDILICEDGACGLCQIEVDGVRSFACQTKIRQGMSIRFVRDHEPSSDLCPCESISAQSFQEKCAQSKPDTYLALSQISSVSQGRCHGLLCGRSCLKVAEGEGVATERFVDWSFPWVDWMFK